MNAINAVRGEVIARRTYHRQRDDGRLETWREVIDRVIQHSTWLESQAGLRSPPEEFAKLRAYFEAKTLFPAGRTLWLGGTETSRRRAACNFNCSALKLQTVHDFVDAMWLLLQGCGVGGKLEPGTITGFDRPIMDIEVIPSTRTDKNGRKHNTETCIDGVWTISVGDSAEAWAKVIGKLLSRKTPVSELTLDFSQIRPPGERLKGYGWICAGSRSLTVAMVAMVKILNTAVRRPLTHMELLDIFNLLGTVLSSRRSAEIALYPYGADGWQAFAKAKDNVNVQPWRTQSNNTLTFEERPSDAAIAEIVGEMIAGGNGEPGLMNMEAARKRAPYCEVSNPCNELLLANYGFCNLSELVLPAFSSLEGAEEAAYLLGRHNYRQTLVDLRDGILQPEWHENNERLRLCGVGLTGIQQAPHLNDCYSLSRIRRAATAGAISLARAAGTAFPANVTTIKPSGTLSKVAGVSEGAHWPIAPFIYNNVNFSIHDPLVEALSRAGYSMRPNPYDASAVIAALPVSFEGATRFSSDVSAFDQLEEYRRLMSCYCDNNVSITVSYVPDEESLITNWLIKHWDEFVGVAFLPRQNDVEQGYKYRPQEVVDEKVWKEYVVGLNPIAWPDGAARGHTTDEVETSSECLTGACPIR